MMVKKHIKMTHVVIAVFILLFLTGLQGVNATVYDPYASYTVRQFPDVGPALESDSAAGGGFGDFWGNISKDDDIDSQHFIEFDLRGLTTVGLATLNFDLYNFAASVTPGLGVSHDVNLAWYVGTGSTNTANFGQGTFETTMSLLADGSNSVDVNVTSIFNSNIGNDFLGFRLYDPVWTLSTSETNQIQYESSTLTTTVVPEPVSTILFITGGVVFGGRSFLRRKRNK